MKPKLGHTGGHVVWEHRGFGSIEDIHTKGYSYNLPNHKHLPPLTFLPYSQEDIDAFKSIKWDIRPILDKTPIKELLDNDKTNIFHATKIEPPDAPIIS